MQAKTLLQQLALDKAQINIGNIAFFKLGSTIRRALVGEQLLRILADQDNSGVSDARVRELLIDSYLWLMEEEED